MSTKLFTFSLAFIFALAHEAAVVAATKNWTGGTGTWSTPGNWNGGTLPLAGDTVYLAPADGIGRTVTYDVSAPALAGFAVDLTGPGTARTTFAMSSGNLTNTGFLIGNLGRATVNHSGGSFVQNDVGLDGAVGWDDNSSGIYNLSGTGTLSLSKDLYVGADLGSSGVINQTGGTANIGRDILFGYNPTATGTYTISSGTLNVGRNAVVGLDGTGTVTVENTGSVHVENELRINASSYVNLNGGTLRFNTVSGLNRLTYTAGTIQLAGSRDLGWDATIQQLFGPATTIPAGKGLKVEGQLSIVLASLLVDGGFVAVDQLYQADSTVEVVNGGMIQFNSLHHMQNPASLLVDGPGSSIVGGGAVWNASHGEAKITFQNQATGEFQGAVTMSHTFDSQVIVDVLSGASLSIGHLSMAADPTTNGIDASANLLVSGNGSIVTQATGSSLTVGNALNGSANLQVNNGGTFRTGTGNITIRAKGAIDLGGGGVFDARGPITLQEGKFNFLGGTLHVETFVGSLTNQGGTLAPGNSAGSTSIFGNYTQQADAELEIEIGGTGTGTQYDFVNITGTAMIDGELSLRLLPGFVPNFSQSFIVFNANNLFGFFDNAGNGQRVATADGLGSFLVNYGPASPFNPKQIVLSAFEATALAGDYNSNGVVDAADYVVWRNGDSPDDTQAGYNLWKANFGKSAGSGVALIVIPEPATWLMLMVGLAMQCRTRRRER